MERRLRVHLEHLVQADARRRDDGNDPYSFMLLWPGGGGAEIDHPCWDSSWPTPVTQDIDDLEDEGLLRVTGVSGDKGRTFDVTPRGRKVARQQSGSRAPEPAMPPLIPTMLWLRDVAESSPEAFHLPSRLLDQAVRDGLITTDGKRGLAARLYKLHGHGYLDGYLPDMDQGDPLQMLSGAEGLELNPMGYQFIGSQGASEQVESGQPLRSEDPRKVMVVHGRDDAARGGMFSFLEGLGLEPQRWGQLVADTNDGSPYIGQVLGRALESVQAVVVLFTPDDQVRLHSELQKKHDPPAEREWNMQARPNVLFEAGLAFGSHPKRTILVELGQTRPLTDLGGRHTVRLNGTAGPLEDLATRLERAGCDLSAKQSDWLKPELFALPARTGLDGATGQAAASLPVGSISTGASSQVLRVLDELIAAALDDPAPDLAPALLTALRDQAEPFHFDEVVALLPGRRRSSEAIKRLQFDLQENEFLERAPGGQRAYVRGPALN